MLSWLKFWNRGKPVLPPAEEVAKRAPTNDSIRTPPPGTKHGAPRYSFTAFDNAPPRRGAYPFTESPPATGTGPILGIDLGTTHACAAVVQDRRIILLANQEGELLTPCVVARGGDGEWLVGEPARRQALTNPNATVRSVKRLLGTEQGVPVGDQTCPPQQLVALVLRKLLDSAEARLGQRVRRAVLTLPVRAAAQMRQAVIEAAEIAGLQVEWTLTDPQTGKSSRRQPMRILAKPTAAALGFGLTTALTHDRRVAVLHLGGGSFDVSLLQIGDGVFDVQAVGGATDLGGDDLDALLANDLAADVEAQHGFDAKADPVAWPRLLQAVEQARRDLSVMEQAEIVLPCFASIPSGPVHLHMTLTRQQLEHRAKPLIGRCREIITQVLADGNGWGSQLDEVALVGGLTRMPMFRRLVREVFGTVPVRVQPPEIVAAGAAIQGDQLQLGSLSDVVLVDVVALSISVETADGTLSRLVERNTCIPVQKSNRLPLPVHQGEVRARIFQGEIDRPVLGALLGEVRLPWTAAREDGQVSPEITCEIDPYGVVEVTLKDPVSGRSRTELLRVSTGLSPADVARLQREAEQERLFRVWNRGTGAG